MQHGSIRSIKRRKREPCSKEEKSHTEIKTEFKSDYDKWISEPAWNSPTDGETAFQIFNYLFFISFFSFFYLKGILTYICFRHGFTFGNIIQGFNIGIFHNFDTNK